MKILLIGLPGCGKSQLLKALAVKSWSDQPFEFFDVDSEIAKIYSKSPRELGEVIKSIGLERFRKQEENCLQGLLSSSNNCVIALGAGGFKLEHLKANLIVIYLKSDLDQAIDLTIKDANRPLGELYAEGELREIFQERVSKYCRAEYSLDGQASIELQITEFKRILADIKTQKSS